LEPFRQIMVNFIIQRMEAARVFVPIRKACDVKSCLLADGRCRTILEILICEHSCFPFVLAKLRRPSGTEAFAGDERD